MLGKTEKATNFVIRPRLLARLFGQTNGFGKVELHPLLLP
jgi:hypothetical protein